MNKGAVTYDQWAPREDQNDDPLGMDLTYSENEGLVPKGVTIKRSYSIDTKFQIRDIPVNLYSLWRKHVPQLIGYPLVVEVSDEDLEAIDDAFTCISSFSSLRRRYEPDHNIWRGVFPIKHDRKILFSQDIEIKAGKLPRWKPHITIPRRILELEDE